MKKQKNLIILLIILTILFASITIVFIIREIRRTSDPMGVDCMPTIERRRGIWPSYEELENYCLNTGGCYCAAS